MGVSSGPTTRVEDPLAAEEVTADGMQPVEKLLLELGMLLREVLPLPAEGRRRLALLLDQVRRHEAGDPTTYRPPMVVAA